MTTDTISNLTSAHNALSNVVSNALSAGDAVSNQISVISQQVSVLSALLVKVQGQNMVRTTTVELSNIVSGATMVDIAGTTVSVSAGGYYEYRAMLNVGCSVANTFRFGITFPAMVANGAGGFIFAAASVGTSAGESVTGGRIQYFDDDGSGSVVMSITKGATSASPLYIQANFAASANGNIILMGATSISTSNLKINPGSFVRLFKLN
jgi:hypothetical protein